MWAEKNVSLVQFYKTALESARNSGYLYIACIVSRYAEFERGFDYLERHWTSFHDLSGEEILILVAGDDIRKKVESERLIGIVDNDKACLSNKNIIVSKSLESIERKRSYFDLQLKEGVAESTCFKSGHTNQTRELMNYFGVIENQLPALCLTSAVTGSTSIYKLDDMVGDEFYRALKYIKTKLINHLSVLSQLGDDMSSIQAKLYQLESHYKDYITYTREGLNTSFSDWRAREFGSDENLDEFLNTFIQLKFRELPKILQEDARRTLKSYARTPKRYKSGRKRLDKYYSIVEYEKKFGNENYDEEKATLETELNTKASTIYEQERALAVELGKYLEVENLKEIADAFDGKINLGITKVDVNILIKGLRKLGARISARF